MNRIVKEIEDKQAQHYRRYIRIKKLSDAIAWIIFTGILLLVAYAVVRCGRIIG